MKFRPQFSLRTLMVVVAIVAGLCWAFWFGWPRWQIYRFESAIQQLRVGMTPNDVKQALPWKGGVVSNFMYGNSSGEMVGVSRFALPNADYCVYFVLQNKGGGKFMDLPSIIVKVYRLPANSLLGNQAAHKFLDFASGKNQATYFDTHCELLYADPPNDTGGADTPTPTGSAPYNSRAGKLVAKLRSECVLVIDRVQDF